MEMRRQIFLSKVLQRVSSPGGPGIAWSKSTMPTLVKVDCLRELVAAAGADPGILLVDFSAPGRLRGHDSHRGGGSSVGGGVGGDLQEARCSFDGGGIDTREGIGELTDTAYLGSGKACAGGAAVDGGGGVPGDHLRPALGVGLT